MQINRKYKDTLFTDIFKRPGYVKRLYLSVHEEDQEIKEEEIEVTTLNNVLTDQPYNDLSMKVRNKYLIFIEAQSTFSKNIVYRMQHYVTDVERRLIQDNHLNLYSSKQIELPMIELYCIYTGNKENKPETISLSHDFFNDQKLDLDVVVHMLYGNKDDIIHEYVEFCKLADDKLLHDISLYNEIPLKSLEELLTECYNKNILKDYTNIVRKEMASLYKVHEMMTQEYASKMYQYEIEDRINKGIQQGIQQGQLNAYIQMYKDGILSFDQLLSYSGLSHEQLNQLL